MGWSLSAAEVFYRKSLAGAAVRGLYRSGTDTRVIVVQSEPASVGEALNCGVNLARYRYLAVVDAPATYNSDALLEAMQAALEEPQRVVGATTSLSVHPVEGLDAALRGEAPTGLGRGAPLPVGGADAAGHRRAPKARSAAGRVPRVHDLAARRRARRRGFAEDVIAVHADMTLRVHAHFGGNRQRYRIIHVAEPVGLVVPADAERLARRARVPFGLMWRHRALFFNPRYGRLGLVDLPRYAFNLLVAPVGGAAGAGAARAGRAARRADRRARSCWCW